MSNVKRFGVVGDGVADETEAIRHVLKDGDGILHFPPGVYRITSTIEVTLEEGGAFGVDGMSGGATIVNAGAGPAFRVRGTHNGTGNPLSIKGNVYPAQRLPTFQNIAIEGAHPEADGIELIKTIHSVFEGVLVRKCRHGIRLTERNRNVLISHSHIYFNTGVGVFLDQVNLHQIIISGSHISYNRLGGIRIERSEVRNLQITGNDIEYNNSQQYDGEAEPTAEIWIDTTADGASVNEVTVSSNTIQATPSPGGANIRILNKRDGSRPPGLWAITGNIIGNQENNVHLTGCYGIAFSGNCIYSCTHRNILLEDCRQITFSGEAYRRHSENLNTGVRVADSRDCVFSGCIWRDEDPAGQTTGASLLELSKSERITINGCQFIDGAPYGIDADECSMLNIHGCTIVDSRDAICSQAAIRIQGKGRHNLIAASTIGKTLQKSLQFSPDSGVIFKDLVGDYVA